MIISHPGAVPVQCRYKGTIASSIAIGSSGQQAQTIGGCNWFIVE